MFTPIIAISKTGRCIILEEFPDDEQHAGLNEILYELEEDLFEKEAGIYSVTWFLSTNNHYHPEYDNTHIEITEFRKLSIGGGL